MAAVPRLLLRARVSTGAGSQTLRHCDGTMGAGLFSQSSRSLSSPCRRRVFRVARLPIDSTWPLSMLPLHSAISSARLKSVLAAESQSWGWVPQGGISTCPLAFGFVVNLSVAKFALTTLSALIDGQYLNAFMTHPRPFGNADMVLGCQQAAYFAVLVKFFESQKLKKT